MKSSLENAETQQLNWRRKTAKPTSKVEAGKKETVDNPERNRTIW